MSCEAADGVERQANVRAVLQEIEEEELLFQTSEEKKRAKAVAVEEEGQKEEPSAEEAKVKVESVGEAKFY